MYSQDDYVTLIQCNQDRRRYRHLARQEPCVSCFDACGSRRRSDTYCLSLRLSLSLSLGWLGPYQILLPFLYISTLFSLSTVEAQPGPPSFPGPSSRATLSPSPWMKPFFILRPFPSLPSLFLFSLPLDYSSSPFLRIFHSLSPFLPKPPLTSAALFISYY